MLEDDRTVETNCHCLVGEDGFPKRQWQNVVCVSDSMLEKSLLNAFDEALSTMCDMEKKRQCWLCLAKKWRAEKSLTAATR